MPVCASCGSTTREGARFCDACGAALPARAAGGAVRKTVTILFSDLVDSTGLAERLDPETVRSMLDRYFDEMRAVLERHGGAVEKFIGDAVVAVFGVPVVHEDDALRAVRRRGPRGGERLLVLRDYASEGSPAPAAPRPASRSLARWARP